VTKEYLGANYCLRVSNDQGTTTYPIKLEAIKTSTGSRMTSQVGLFLAAALFIAAFI